MVLFCLNLFSGCGDIDENSDLLKSDVFMKKKNFLCQGPIDAVLLVLLHACCSARSNYGYLNAIMGIRISYREKVPCVRYLCGLQILDGNFKMSRFASPAHRTPLLAQFLLNYETLYKIMNYCLMF